MLENKGSITLFTNLSKQMFLTLKDLRTGRSSGFQSNIHASDKYILSFILVRSVFRSIRVNT